MAGRVLTLIVGLVVLGLSAEALAAEHRRLEGVVNINSATPEQLRLLGGVGPAKIRNIVAYRRAHPFRTVEELVRIKGIGRKMVRKLRMNLAVSGPTTAQIVIRPLDPEPFVGPPLPPSPARKPPQPARRLPPLRPTVPVSSVKATHCDPP